MADVIRPAAIEEGSPIQNGQSATNYVNVFIAVFVILVGEVSRYIVHMYIVFIVCGYTTSEQSNLSIIINQNYCRCTVLILITRRMTL